MKHQNPNIETAFVLGNGVSRLRLNHNQLPTLGTVYACNAIYREFEPDFLVAVDVKMVNEIVASGWHRTHQVWTNPNKGINDKKHINFFSPHKGWSSGPTALGFSVERGHKEVYIFGFDYQGNQGRFNNIYADTYNYKKSTDVATYHGNWLSQTERVIREWKNVNFYRVVEDSGFIPDRLENIPNLKHISYEDFGKIYPDCIYDQTSNQKTTI